MSESNLDILITRVIDQRANAQDWVELEAAGSADPTVWRELALAQRDDSALRATVLVATAGADDVVLGGTEGQLEVRHEAGVRERLRRVGMWSGWAAAAAVVLAVFAARSPQQNGLAGLTSNPAGGIKPQVAGLALPEVLENYINRGKLEGTVIGELPQKLLLDSTRTPDGRTEVTFVRQIVERVKLDDLYRTTVDEAGKVQPLKIEIRTVDDKSAT